MIDAENLTSLAQAKRIVTALQARVKELEKSKKTTQSLAEEKCRVFYEKNEHLNAVLDRLAEQPKWWDSNITAQDELDDRIEYARNRGESNAKL